MTAGVISIPVDDLDQVVDCTAVTALSNLAKIHELPRLEHIYRVDHRDGRTIVFVAVPHHAAEAWRAALGAPPFTEKPLPTSVQHTTERSCWFGATVRLCYSTLA